MDDRRVRCTLYGFDQRGEAIGYLFTDAYVTADRWADPCEPRPSGYLSTQVGWVSGNTYYVCDSPSMRAALQMAVSMHAYGNGQ